MEIVEPLNSKNMKISTCSGTSDQTICVAHDDI